MTSHFFAPATVLHLADKPFPTDNTTLLPIPAILEREMPYKKKTVRVFDFLAFLFEIVFVSEIKNG
jgi:hypothetical protein